MPRISKLKQREKRMWMKNKTKKDQRPKTKQSRVKKKLKVTKSAKITKSQLTE